MWLALLVVLTDGVITVPALDSEAIEVKISDHGTTLHCAFNVQRDGSRVQVLLMERRQAARFARGHGTQFLYSSGFESEGRFRTHVRDAGDYVLILDNGMEARHSVDVNLRLELTNPRNLQVRELSQERRSAVIALSFIFLGMVVFLSTRQFLRQNRR